MKHLNALAEAGSFTKAATKLNIAQPALSQSIKRLEHSLEVTLVNRDRSNLDKKIALTAEGHALQLHAKQIINQVKQAEAHIRSMANLSSGEVRIAVPGMLGSFYLPSRLMAFRHKYPDLKLSLFEAGSRNTLRMLKQGEVDIAIVAAQDLTPELESRLLIHEQMMIAMGPEHELASQQTICLNEFLDHELVIFKEGYFHREWLIDQARRLDKKLNIAFETNLIALIKEVVSHGYAATCVLDLVISNEDNILVKPLEPPVFLDLHIAWKKDRPVSQADRAFVDFLMQSQ